MNTDRHTIEIIRSRLDTFDTISLKEMDSVKLLDRTDMKFLTRMDQLVVLLNLGSPLYKVLAIEDSRFFGYLTEYYDTPVLNMYRDHHNGRPERFKVRTREYIESNLCFLEVKFKNNKGRVKKSRIVYNGPDQHAFNSFIREHSPYDPDNLYKILTNRFNRITLVDHSLSERVTMDFNLSYSDSVSRVALNGLVIIEIKQDQQVKYSKMLEIMRTLAIRPSGMSKYCIGVALLQNHQKSNLFKESLIKINKLSLVERQQ